MSHDIQDAKNAITLPSLRDSLPDNRVGSLIQVSTRTEVDDDGNTSVGIVRVERSEFVSHLIQDECTAVEHVPEVKNPSQALRAAVARCKKGANEHGGDDGDASARTLWRRLGVDSLGVTSYALIATSADPRDKSWSGMHLCTVTIGGKDEDGNDLEDRPARVYPEPLTDEQQAVVDGAYASLEERYKEEREYLHSDDVRRFVNRLMTASGALGVGGMLHLALRDGDDMVRRAERALVAAGYQVLIQPMTSGENLGPNVRNGLLFEVSALTKDIANLSARREKQKANGKEGRLASFDARLSKAHDMKNRVELFRDVVGNIGDDIEDAVANAEKAVRDIMKEMVLSI